MQQDTFDVPADEIAQIRAEMRAQIDEMKRINERTRENQHETERLKAKTRATLAKLAEFKVL